MKLSRHDRYDYSPITERPDYDWPDGKRLAFYLALNIEHFHFGEGRGHTPTREAPHPDHRNYAWRDYGLRVGIWRIFDLLDELGLPAAHLLNSTVYDHAPQILDRIRARGDEIVGHGRTNSEAQGQLSEADEAALIAEATETIAQHEGKAPDGWLGPWISESLLTPDLLKEAGYSYLLDWPFDDQPIWMRTRAGPILSIPYPVEINDSPALLNRRHTADDFAQMAIDQFEQLLADSKHQPLVCGISTHTFAVGQPFRLPHLRRMLEHVVNHPEVERVWFTRPGDIARHIAALEPGIVPRS
jgi:peptidoglycan/xylan/chitin deacetylase (PgdA/CDA1 family)